MDESMIELQCQKNKEKIVELCKEGNEYIIYGAGFWGFVIYHILKWNGMEEYIKYIVVTDENNTQNIDKKKTISIFDVKEIERQNDVLIICSEKFENEMECIAKELQFCHVILYKDVLYTLNI
jgi:hypothetical protein